MFKYNTIKLNTIILIFVLVFAVILVSCKSKTSDGSLPEKEKITINNDYSFVYEFNMKPKIGMVILKVQVKDKNDKPATFFKITGDAYMPSMKGSHDTGDVEFKLNKKGDYLLPVNVVMPGDWEIHLKFLDKNKKVFEGRIKFDV